jgi:HemY protein
MRAIIWFLLLFAVAVVAATTFGANDGLVSIYWADWRLDTSLNLFVIVLALTCVVVMSAFQAVSSLVGLPRRAHEWRVARRDRSAQAALRNALAQYFGGRYTRAQSAARRALAIQADTPDLAQDNEFTMLGHLLAAGSAHRLQDRAKRDESLRHALELARRSFAARPAEEGARLLAAEWALDDRDAARALELLSGLPPGVARRTHALRLKLHATRLAQQPLEALRTARLLAKHQAFSKVAARGLLRSLAAEAMATARDAEQLRRVWLQFDNADRRDPCVAADAAERAAELGAPEDARMLLRPFWDGIAELSADERVAVAKGLVAATSGIGPDWIPRIEAAAKTFPREAAIAHAAGTALAECRLWGKARQLLDVAVADSALPPSQRRQALLTLAHIAEEEGDTARVTRNYAAAARLLD